MTVATPTQAECAYCGGERDPTTSINGSYCSLKCYWRQKGENTLRQVANDHTYCSTCYAKLKHVEEPTQSFLDRIQVENGRNTRDAIIGFEYHTPSLLQDHGYTYCRCGNVAHDAEIDFLQDEHLRDVLVNLWQLVVEYYQDGQFGDHRPDRDVFFSVLREGEGLDFRLALGRAIYDG